MLTDYEKEALAEKIAYQKDKERDAEARFRETNGEMNSATREMERAGEAVRDAEAAIDRIKGDVDTRGGHYNVIRYDPSISDAEKDNARDFYEDANRAHAAAVQNKNNAESDLRSATATYERARIMHEKAKDDWDAAKLELDSLERRSY